MLQGWTADDPYGLEGSRVHKDAGSKPGFATTSCGCGKMLTQAWWLKTAEISSTLGGQESELSIAGLKLRCWQGSRAESVPCFFQLLVTAGLLRLMPTSLHSSSSASHSLCSDFISEHDEKDEGSGKGLAKPVSLRGSVLQPPLRKSLFVVLWEEGCVMLWMERPSRTWWHSMGEGLGVRLLMLQMQSLIDLDA